MKVLAILYSGGVAAKEEPRLLGTLENELGLREYLESQGHQLLVRNALFVTLYRSLTNAAIVGQVSDDKEGPDSFFQKHISDVSMSHTFPPRLSRCFRC